MTIQRHIPTMRSAEAGRSLYVNRPYHVSISAGVGQGSPRTRKGIVGPIFQPILPSRLYSGPVFCHTCSAAVFQNGLSRHRRLARRLLGPPGNSGIEKGTAFHCDPKSRTTAPKKRAFDRLLDAVFQRARARGLIGPDSEASLDATGLESHHISRHFLQRSGRMKQFRRFPKMTILCDNQTHLIAGVLMGKGPNNDSPGLPPVMRQAARNLSIDILLADAAFDSEPHHRFCREELGIRRTAIPINDRGRPDLIPSTRYRREMKKRFPRARFGQRWQVESVFSRQKRRLGSALRARSDESRMHEGYLRVLTHNLMILRLCS
jgi:hypothetical protein